MSGSRFGISRTARQVGIHLALALGAVVIVLPFALMVSMAVSPPSQAYTSVLPTGGLALDNFRVAWEEAPWIRYYINGAVVTGLIFLGQIATCLPAGYALARRNFRGRNAMLVVVILALVIPAQVIAMPVFVLISRLGLVDQLGALVLPFLTSAFGIFLFRQFVMTIPSHIFDAARVDGVGHFGIVWRVVLPNVKPAVLAFGIFSIVSHWNDLFWPSVVLRTTESATVPFAIAQFTNPELGVRPGVQMAAAALAATPLILAFLAAQRHFVNGLAFTRAR